MRCTVRYENDMDDIEAMLKILLRKLDRDEDDEVPVAQPRVTDSQRQHRNSDMQNIVSYISIRLA